MPKFLDCKENKNNPKKVKKICVDAKKQCLLRSLACRGERALR